MGAELAYSPVIIAELAVVDDSEAGSRDGADPRSHSVTFPAQGGSGSQASRYSTTVVKTMRE